MTVPRRELIADLRALAEAIHYDPECTWCTGEEGHRTYDYDLHPDACAMRIAARWNGLSDADLEAAIEGKRGTSRAAAIGVFPKSGTQRRLLLDTYLRHGPLTDRQAELATGLAPNSLRPRRVELVDGGWVHHLGVVYDGGAERILWGLTGKARDHLTTTDQGALL